MHQTAREILQGIRSQRVKYEGKIADGKLAFTDIARFQYELRADEQIKVNTDGRITDIQFEQDESINSFHNHERN